MPLVKRHIPYALRLADKDLYGQGETGAGTSNGPAILRDVNMGAMTGTLQQLGYLAAYSSEMFQELLILIEEVSSRAVSLKERCNALEEKLPNAITRTTNAVKGQGIVEGDDLELLEVLRASRSSANQAQAKETMSILLPQSMPLPLAERYYSDEVTPMPALERIDECLGDVGLTKLAAKGLTTYSFEYSYPGFFYEEWQRLESQRLDRLTEEKKQRKTERRARKRREAELALSQNEIGGANALAIRDEGMPANGEELVSDGRAKKNLKGSLVGRHKKSKRSETKERQKGKKPSAAVAMVSHETVEIEDVDPTKDALVYQRDEYEEYLVPSYPTDLEQKSKPKQHDVTSLEKYWDSTTAAPPTKRTEAAHFAFMPKGSRQTEGEHKAVQGATESSSALPDTPSNLSQGQSIPIDEPRVSLPSVVPPHPRALPTPPAPSPVGPEATAALFATKRRKQHTSLFPAGAAAAADAMPQVVQHKEAAASVLPVTVVPPPPPVPERISSLPATVAPALGTPGPEMAEKKVTLPARPPPPIPVVVAPTIRHPPPALPAELPVRTTQQLPSALPSQSPPHAPPDIDEQQPLPPKVIPKSSSKDALPLPKPPTTADPQPIAFHHPALPWSSSTSQQHPVDLRPEFSSSPELMVLQPPPPSDSDNASDSERESAEKLSSTTSSSLPILSDEATRSSSSLHTPSFTPPAPPPENALELSELVEVLPNPSIVAPPVPPPMKSSLELKELVEVLPPTVSSPIADHVVVVGEEPAVPPPTLPSGPTTNVETLLVPPIPTGIAPQPPTTTSIPSDTVPVPVVSVHVPPPPPMTERMLEQNYKGSSVLASESSQVFHESISVTTTLGSFNDDSLSYNEDPIAPLPVNTSSRGIGDLLESIKGGATQLKKVEPETQQTMPPRSLGAFANPGINTILERRKYLEADDSDSETDTDDDDWE